MLEITKSCSYTISTYDVKMVIGSGETKEEALRDYIESASDLIHKTEIELNRLKENVKEANLYL